MGSALTSLNHTANTCGETQAGMEGRRLRTWERRSHKAAEQPQFWRGGLSSGSFEAHAALGPSSAILGEFEKIQAEKQAFVHSYSLTEVNRQQVPPVGEETSTDLPFTEPTASPAQPLSCIFSPNNSNTL